MKQLILLSIFLSYATLSAGSIGEHLRACYRLDALCTSLYGEKHPLQQYITSHQRLIAYYVKSMRCHKKTHRNNNTTEIETTLETLKEYITTLLNQYQIEHPITATPQSASTPATSLAEAPITLPSTIGSTTIPTLNVTPAPNTTPAQTDAAMHQYLTSVQNAQNQHAQAIYEETQKKFFKEQKALLFVGLGIITVTTLILRIFFTDHTRKLAAIAKDYKKLEINMGKHSFEISKLNSRG